MPLASRLAAAVLVLVAAVTLWRGVEALGGRLLSGADERELHTWAAGDPRIEERLAAAAPSLPPGVGVRLLVPDGTDEGWATYRGLYHLPRQRILGIHFPGEAPPPPDAWLVDVTAAPPRITPAAPAASSP